MPRLGKACAHFVLTGGKNCGLIHRIPQPYEVLCEYYFTFSSAFPVLDHLFFHGNNRTLTSLAHSLSPISTGPINSCHEENIRN